MARLDRLSSAKEVAQIGAVIGREFPHALIAAVACNAEPELRSALDRLIDAGLLFRQGVAPHATYLFKHALVQDAAYGTLLREPRRALHARIAETLENEFAEIAESQPELLARHFTEAGQIEKSALLWGKAPLPGSPSPAHRQASYWLWNLDSMWDRVPRDNQGFQSGFWAWLFSPRLPLPPERLGRSRALRPLASSDSGGL
jgi:hypothetical protein